MIDPAPLTPAPPRPGRRLLQPGNIEIVLAAVLALVTIALDVLTGRPWPPLALDLAACIAAALSGRWPRSSAVVLGILLGTYLVIPPGWATMGEYALLIPILGAGMRGRRLLRLVESVAYWLILVGLMLQNAPSFAGGLLGGLVWAVLIGLQWLIGNVFVTVADAHRQAHRAAIVLQRQQVALELHDTVARSLSTLAMTAERARLRGAASPDDLDLIARTASDSVGQLRQVITLLGSPDAGPPAERTPTALPDVLASAEAALARHGFTPRVHVSGDPELLGTEAGELLGAASAEALHNIVTHGDPDRACLVSAEITPTGAVLQFANAPRGDAQATHGTSLGLGALRQRIEAAGGRVTAGRADSQWLTRVDLPLPLTTSDGEPVR